MRIQVRGLGWRRRGRFAAASDRLISTRRAVRASWPAHQTMPRICAAASILHPPVHDLHPLHVPPVTLSWYLSRVRRSLRVLSTPRRRLMGCRARAATSSDWSQVAPGVRPRAHVQAGRGARGLEDVVERAGKGSPGGTVGVGGHTRKMSDAHRDCRGTAPRSMHLMQHGIRISRPHPSNPSIRVARRRRLVREGRKGWGERLQEQRQERRQLLRLAPREVGDDGATLWRCMHGEGRHSAVTREGNKQAHGLERAWQMQCGFWHWWLKRGQQAARLAR